MANNIVSFDRVANLYDKTRGIEDNVMENIISNIVKEYKEIDKWSILDAGIGTGRFSIPLSKHAKKITGIDISTLMIDELNKKNVRPNVNVLLGDVTNMPFEDNTFDCVIAVSILHLVANWQKGIEEIKRVIKSNGIFILGRTEYLNKDSEIYENVRHRFFKQLVSGVSDRGLDFDDQINVLSNLFGEPKIIDGPLSSSTKKIDDILDGFRKRIWSETWNVSDKELNDVIDKIEQYILGIDLNLNDYIYFDTCFRTYGFTISKDL